MELFIPNTNKRYSITSEGVVYSNYEFSTVREKINKRKIVKKIFKGRTKNTSPIFYAYRDKKKTRSLCINSVMVKLFKIKKPDSKYRYQIFPKDGDWFNNSLENLEYRLRMSQQANFYPKSFYNEKGEIIKKVCKNCGETIDIKHFIQCVYKNNNKVHINVCNRCRSKSTYEAIKKDPKKFRRYLDMNKEWKEKNKKRYNETRRSWGLKNEKFHRDNLTTRYIYRTILHFDRVGLSKDDLTPQLMELTKKRVLLKRQLKQTIKN